MEIRLLKNKNEFHIITATLLAYNGETSLVRTLSYKIITVKSDAIMFENVPDTLVTKPSLIWNIKTHKDTTTKMKLDYLISGISFQSNYVLHINNNNANFTGWISINNRSGKKFKNVKLSLLTGTIQRKEKSFEGYYFYTIPFPVTLQNNETTQIKFIQDNNISIQRLYSVTLTNPLYLQGQKKYDVSQFIFFKGLHKPLIKGAIRIYTKQDQTILLSENSIQQTPKHKDIKLKTGTNFDLKATQTLIKRSDSNEWINVDIEYMLTNNSDTNKTIEVLVPFNTNNNSKVRTDETYSFTKGNLVTFIVNINANSIKKFNVNYESKK